jgi:hypothetical protein
VLGLRSRLSSKLAHLYRTAIVTPSGFFAGIRAAPAVFLAGRARERTGGIGPTGADGCANLGGCSAEVVALRSKLERKDRYGASVPIRKGGVHERLYAAG